MLVFLLLLFELLGISLLPKIATSTTITAAHLECLLESPPRSPATGGFTHSRTLQQLAHSLKSESFLKELCKRKNTSRVTFYSLADNRDCSCAKDSALLVSATTTPSIRQNSPFGTAHALLDSVSSTATKYRRNRSFLGDNSAPFACEYDGKLWFKSAHSKAGIKFRETVHYLKHRHPCTLLCTTDYFNGQKWVPCAVVTCHLREETTGLAIHTSSEILVPFMPRLIQIAINKKIASTFDAAVKSFISNVYDPQQRLS